MDENTANNQVAISTTVIREADVSVRVQAGPDPVVAGRKITFVITVKNNGASLANNVRIDHQLPSGMTLDVSSSDPGVSQLANNTVRFTIPTLSTGVEQKVLVTATVASSAPAGMLTSTTSVTANESDPLLGNNQASTVTNVSALQATNKWLPTEIHLPGMSTRFRRYRCRRSWRTTSIRSTWRRSHSLRTEP